MRIFSNFSIFNIMEGNWCCSLITTQSYAIIINGIVFFIIKNCSSTCKINIIRNLLYTFIKLSFVNSFITIHSCLYARNYPIVACIICNINFCTPRCHTNGNSTCISFLLNEAVFCRIRNLILDIRDRSINSIKSRTNIIMRITLNCVSWCFTIRYICTTTKIL